ncbi:Protein-tyrosine-phosphatase IBR5 [Cardamine amara subsp. amara]|uniref:Protein-tyrosine-phosphatase IBR5 n=1 Tax=Cardamine amara subsp. amara TaxID=228776 RepID=A0ABD1C874_CARAN
MGKRREREEPCDICGHYHEEGEVCNICGHHVTTSGIANPIRVTSLPSEILPDFLYLSGINEAFLFEILKTLGISHILNTVPSYDNPFPKSILYHRLQDAKALEFDSAIKFIDECEKSKARVLVHCISGKSRSPAIVVAYLMRRKGWRLAESYQWVKQRRPLTDISPEFQQQLKEFEERLFGLPQLQDLALGAVNDDTPVDRS